MNNTNHKDSLLIIYKKYLDLLYYSNDIVRKYPKCEKFALVNEIKNSLYDGLRNIIFAEKEFNKSVKLKYLNELDANMKLLKVHMKISLKYQYISLKNYETWSCKITDVCNLLGAWIKSCASR